MEDDDRPMSLCSMGGCGVPARRGSNFCERHGAPTPRKGPGKPARPSISSPAARLNSQMVCPHCQTKGQVRTAQVKQKQGISGGKATGAVLTAGLSLFATGLSRKRVVTEATCSQCGVKWTIG